MKHLAIVAALASGGLLVDAAEAADLEKGRLVAEKCAKCHAVDAAGASPDPKSPPFRELGRRYPIENLQEALAEGLVVGHGEMPEFRLSPEQIDDFLGYLSSIQTK